MKKQKESALDQFEANITPIEEQASLIGGHSEGYSTNTANLTQQPPRILSFASAAPKPTKDGEDDGDWVSTC